MVSGDSLTVSGDLLISVSFSAYITIQMSNIFEPTKMIAVDAPFVMKHRRNFVYQTIVNCSVFYGFCAFHLS